MSQSPTGRDTDDRDGYLAGWSALYGMLRQTGSFSGRERHCAYLNTGGIRFANVSAVAGLDFLDDGRGAAVVDWDQDGALDLWLRNRSGPSVRFMHNTIDSGNHYLAVLLEGRYCNRDAIGARVELYLRGQPQGKLIRTLRAGEAYLAQTSKWLHFGLGGSSAIDRLVVRWPGGKAETFHGLSADRRYKIVQGSDAAQRWSRPQRSVRLVASQLDAPPVSDRARIVLAARMPMPRLGCRDFAGKAMSLTDGQDGPLLINLWASWCPPCVAELTDLGRHQDQLRDAGLRVVILNVDEPEKRSDAVSVLARLNLSFEAGLAPPELLDVLDTLQRGVLDRKRRLPLPTSFLVDANRRLAVIYKGPLEAEVLLKDVALLKAEPDAIRAAAASFPGKWYLPPPRPDLAGMADKFRRQGLTEIAQQYLALLASRSSTAPRDPGQDERLARIEYNLGVALAGEGKLAEAAAAYRKALAANPQYVQAHINLGIILSKQGDLDGAVRQYEQALGLDPNHVLAHHNLAIALFGLGRTEEGNAHLATAQRLRSGG